MTSHKFSEPPPLYHTLMPHTLCPSVTKRLTPSAFFAWRHLRMTLKYLLLCLLCTAPQPIVFGLLLSAKNRASQRDGIYADSLCSFRARIHWKKNKFFIIKPVLQQVCANSVFKFTVVNNSNSPQLPPLTLIMQTSTHTYPHTWNKMWNFACYA